MCEIFILKGRFVQKRQVCTCMSVVFVSQWHFSRWDADSYVHPHSQLNVPVVTTHLQVQLELACTCKISSKTAILLSMGTLHEICAM